MYAAGNLTAPQLFISSEYPRYPTAFRGMIAAFVSIIVLEIILFVYLVWENRRRDRKYGKVDRTQEIAEPLEEDFLDLTDKEQPHFRYMF